MIRPLTADDAGELAALLVENRAFLAPFEPDRIERFYTAEGQRERLERDDKHAFAILDGDRIAGTVALSNVVLGPHESATVPAIRSPSRIANACLSSRSSRSRWPSAV